MSFHLGALIVDLLNKLKSAFAFDLEDLVLCPVCAFKV